MWPKFAMAAAAMLILCSSTHCRSEEDLVLKPPWTGKLPASETHPCLFFSSEDLPMMRERITREPYKSAWESVLHATDVEENDAFIWLMTGDEDAAKRARYRIVNTRIYREPVHGYIEPSSHALMARAIAYDFLASWEGLSEADHRKIRETIAAECEYYQKTMDSVPGGCNFGNQRTLGAGALGMSAIALRDFRGDGHTPDEWLARALYEVRRPDNFWFFRPDGSFVEGYGYSCYMACTWIPFMTAYTRNCGQNLFQDETLRNWLRYLAYFMLPDGRHVNFGTASYTLDGTHVFPVLANRAFTGKDAGLYAWATTQLFKNTVRRRQPWLLIAHFDDTIPTDGQAFPTADIYPISEQMVMKSSWDDDLTGVWITGKDAFWKPHRYRTYSHCDVGQFLFYSGGEILAVDSGYPHWTSQDCYGPEFHNIVLVDGEGPAQDTFGELEDAVTSPDADAATITTSYAGHGVQRVFLFAQKRVLLVADFLQPDEDAMHEYMFQLHSPITVGAAEAQFGPNGVTWPGYNWNTSTVSETTLSAVLAGEDLSVKQVPSHWLPKEDKPTDNIAMGATWKSSGPTNRLSAIWAQQPGETEVIVTQNDADGIQKIRATSAEWSITAQSRAVPGMLQDGGAITRAQLLITGRQMDDRGAIGNAKWVYVWGARGLRIPGLDEKDASAIRRGLLLWTGNEWQIVSPASGT